MARISSRPRYYYIDADHATDEYPEGYYATYGVDAHLFFGNYLIRVCGAEKAYIKDMPGKSPDKVKFVREWDDWDV